MPRKHPFVQAVKDGLRFAGVDFSRPLLIAVSGGPDSTALLLACCEIHRTDGLQVIAGHFNHRLRAGADGDALHAAQLSEKLGVRFVSGAGDVAGRSRQQGETLEVAARDMRYGFLAGAARDSGAQGVATGHTLDDQAETVLLHLVRGAGLRGLSGMQPATDRVQDGPIPSLRVFRPMLAVRHSNAVAFCDERGEQPRMDPTNSEVRFARNRVRLKILPEMEKLNPRIAEALARLAESASADHQAMNALMEQYRKSVTLTGGRLSRTALTATPGAVAARLLIEAYESAAGTADGLERSHIEGMLSAARAGAGRSIDLPGGLMFEVRHGDVRLTRQGQADDGDLPLSVPEATLAVPGRVALPGGFFITARVVRLKAGARPPSPDTAFIDRGIALTALTVRPRRPGDLFHPLGMDGPVRLQDFFTGQHVPRDWRGRTPLIDTPRGIVWVAGGRIAEWAKVPADATVALRLDMLRPQGAVHRAG
ncbi:MAG: tRNA lysidine(34) synthetase TilS [Dehalococcoidia bacterium]|nr:tRNA lysidine(34) synthetase TilS [Dehalococcoidia bacterium]